jgi:hypothetical protein
MNQTITKGAEGRVVPSRTTYMEMHPARQLVRYIAGRLAPADHEICRLSTQLSAYFAAGVRNCSLVEAVEWPNEPDDFPSRLLQLRARSRRLSIDN